MIEGLEGHGICPRFSTTSLGDRSLIVASTIWECGCGEVQLELRGEPDFVFDCHCSACTPIARYLDEKSRGKGISASPNATTSGKAFYSFGKGISAVTNSTGVAKAFYTLDKVKYVRGRDNVAGIKLGETGENIRSYTMPLHRF